MHSKNYPRNHEGYFDLIKKLSLRYEYRVADFEEYLCICLNANKAAVIEIKIGEKYWTQEGFCWNTENIKKCMTSWCHTVKKDWIIVSLVLTTYY